MAKKKRLSEYVGWGLVALGVIIVLSALPLIQQSIVSVGPVSADVSEINATRIIVGVVIFFLGLVLVGSKKFLKAFS